MRYDINTQWEMRQTTENKWLQAKVPGSVYNDLLENKIITDPYFRENEYQMLDLCCHDYEYRTSFNVSDEILNNDEINIVFNGLDTLATIYLNDKLLAKTNNMHRTYRFDIKSLLYRENNKLNIVFKSPINYIESAHKKDPIYGSPDAVSGISHLRKGHSMFGWDWGPKLPDMGIWRDIYLEGHSTAKISDVYISQKHTNNKVDLSIKTEIKKFIEQEIELLVNIYFKDTKILSKKILTNKEINYTNLTINDPELWWPNNMGKQPLYDIEIILIKDDIELSKVIKRIGLRTLTIKQQKDEWGESFEFCVNDISFFAMGANYIPEDNILSRCNKVRTESLIKKCVDSNMNCIRIWGGGYYPEDYFYDLCDKYGLVVWQDFMYACAVYRFTEEFECNVTHEIIDNVRRLRHHASLGLWCGNNENEGMFQSWEPIKNYEPLLKRDYIKQFQVLIPQILHDEDPDTFYWPSSPSTVGSFIDVDNEKAGDVHDWSVWHGLKPFTYFQKHYYRFLSEFGLQAIPNIKTINSFTLPEDRNLFSPVMENHQKNTVCNWKIMYYISANYRYPKDFKQLTFASQLIQADGIKYAVEHLRRHRGHCMGAIYWQLNDCWPGISWSSIDYYGRLKALHYSAKRFFNPLLISVKELERNVDENDKPSNRYYKISPYSGAEIHVTNDTFNTVSGKVMWALKDNDGNIISDGYKDIPVEKLSSTMVTSLDFTKYLDTREKVRNTYLEYKWVVNKSIVSSGTLLFVKPKHYNFERTNFKLDIKENDNAFIINIESDKYAKFIELDLTRDDAIFSDNYFDLSANEQKEIICSKDDLSCKLSLDQFKQQLSINSVYDIDK